MAKKQPRRALDAAPTAPDRFTSRNCSRYFKALADPERMLIVEYLRHGPLAVGDICKRLDSPFGNVSHHLKLLRQAGLIEGRKEGRFVFYELARRLAVHPRGSWVTALDFGCCRVELAKHNAP